MLPASCQATKSYFSLVCYFEGNSSKEAPNPVDIMLKQNNISDICVWDNIKSVIPFGHTSFTLPDKVENLEDFP